MDTREQSEDFRRGYQAGLRQSDEWVFARNVRFWVSYAVTGIILLSALGLYGCPQYTVYEQQLAGEAELKRAEQNRQILVQQATAEREAAKARAEAIEVVGAAAKAFPEYRQQEFIGAFAEALKEGKMNQIIYVPTEANIPIIEAGKRPVSEK